MSGHEVIGLAINRASQNRIVFGIPHYPQRSLADGLMAGNGIRITYPTLTKTP